MAAKTQGLCVEQNYHQETGNEQDALEGVVAVAIVNIINLIFLSAVSTVMAMMPKKMDAAQRGASLPHACQSLSTSLPRMWYSSPNAIKQSLLSHENALTNVRLACGHQAQPQSPHEIFNWQV